jgi:hypothetical protein
VPSSAFIAAGRLRGQTALFKLKFRFAPAVPKKMPLASRVDGPCGCRKLASQVIPPTKTAPETGAVFVVVKGPRFNAR